jgi:hypothetical protein
MSAIVVTKEQVAPVNARDAEIIPVIAGEAIDYGDPVFIKTTTGKAFKTLAAAAGTAKFAGFSLSKAGAGQAVDVMKKGWLFGWTISALAYGAAVYAGDTGGADTAAGTVSLQIATVVPLTDPALTKVLYVDANWLTGAFAAGA